MVATTQNAIAIRSRKNYLNLKTAEIIVNSLIDWKGNTIFGIPGDGINGIIEAL
jgi:hypothetical protein